MTKDLIILLSIMQAIQVAPTITDEALQHDETVIEQTIETPHNEENTPHQEPTQEIPTIEKTPTIYEVTEFNTSIPLRKGISSDEVIRLKIFLKEKGYDLVENYYFDETTNMAVKDYQSKTGLLADGIVGSGTKKQINKDMSINNINIPLRTMTVSKAPTTGQWLIINKSNNTLYHLKGTELINKYPVATGKEKDATPEGKFSIVIKTKNPAWGGAYGKYKPIKGGAYNNPLGKRWIGLSVGGGGEYGIHGNYAPNSIGTYASLGCVRMNNTDVEYLFDIIPKGAPVWIGHETKLNELGIKFK